jgi:hypothetical protein
VTVVDKVLESQKKSLKHLTCVYLAAIYRRRHDRGRIDMEMAWTKLLDVSGPFVVRSSLDPLPVHNCDFWLEILCSYGEQKSCTANNKTYGRLGDRTLDLQHAKQTRYHCARRP